MQAVTQDSTPVALTAEQALALLGGVISRSSFYNAIRRGEVPHRRLGKRIIIPRHAFLRWLEAEARLIYAA
jgi:excisionase family DNA binding protein